MFFCNHITIWAYFCVFIMIAYESVDIFMFLINLEVLFWVTKLLYNSSRFVCPNWSNLIITGQKNSALNLTLIHCCASSGHIPRLYRLKDGKKFHYRTKAFSNLFIGFSFEQIEARPFIYRWPNYIAAVLSKIIIK